MATDALHYLGAPSAPETALAYLAEPVRRWFRQRFGNPTLAQRLAWPALSRKENLLLSSPTGSGKTLAAFGSIISELLNEPAQGLRCLYVAPLKALGNDARKNLRRHLQGIRALLSPEFPRIRVGLRTGDTSSRVRQRLWTDPPAILLTTPESLAILLTQAAAVELFRDLRWLVVDEIHALAGNKRGTDLALSLERLQALLGEEHGDRSIQRVGLSATCAPLETAARFLVGTGRPCSVAEVAESSPLILRIEPLPDPEPASFRGNFLARLLDRLEPEVANQRTTLIFTNVRSLAERLTWALRRRYPERVDQIGVHHSALAAVRRRLVERRLKQGKLWVVVSSTSLELGIDIGSVDGVVLVHPPGGVVRLLQRVGRSGHNPQHTRRGLVLTSTPAALLEATVTAASSRSAQVEPLRVPVEPLDVLCQHLLGMAVQSCWSADEAFHVVRRAYPFRDLKRADFDACLDYLSGRHRDGREWLPSRLRWEGTDFTIVDERTTRLMRRNLGTIMAEENRPVRLQDKPSRLPTADGFEARAPLLGEVDEMFADRLEPGDRFVLDGRCLEYQRKDGSALLVAEVAGRPQVPRWSGTGLPLSGDLARRIYLFRMRAAEALRDGPEALTNMLQREYGLEAPAAQELVDLFTRQETLSEIPDQAACLIECVPIDVGAEYYIHTHLTRAGNDALARVAGLRLGRDLGIRSTAIAADLGLLLSTTSPKEITASQWRDLFSSAAFDADLELSLRDSITLRERFRQTAYIGLMLLRNPLGNRRRVGGRDWADRQLFDQVRAADPEFVLVRQAWREVLEGPCNAEAARSFVDELPERGLRCRWLAQVSPLAENWTEPAVTATDVLTSSR